MAPTEQEEVPRVLDLAWYAHFKVCFGVIVMRKTQFVISSVASATENFAACTPWGMLCITVYTWSMTSSLLP